MHEPADSSRLFVLQQMEDSSNVQGNSNRFKGLFGSALICESAMPDFSHLNLQKYNLFSICANHILFSFAKVHLPGAIYLRGAILFVALYHYFIFDIALHAFEGAQEASGDKVADVAQGGVGRDLGELGIVLGGELALVAVEV